MGEKLYLPQTLLGGNLNSIEHYPLHLTKVQLPWIRNSDTLYGFIDTGTQNYQTIK